MRVDSTQNYYHARKNSTPSFGLTINCKAQNAIDAMFKKTEAQPDAEKIIARIKGKIEEAKAKLPRYGEISIEEAGDEQVIFYHNQHVNAFLLHSECGGKHKRTPIQALENVLNDLLGKATAIRSREIAVERGAPKVARLNYPWRKKIGKK